MAAVAEEEILVVEENEETVTNNRIRFFCVATWKIKNFNSCQMECGEELFSPMFSTNSSVKLKWYLSIFPNGKENFEDYVSFHVIFIRPTETNLIDLRASCRVSILDSESKVWISDRIDQNLARFQFNTFVTKERLLSEKDLVFPRDVLTIRCQISALDERLFELGAETSNNLLSHCNDPLQLFANDFKEFFLKGKFGDVTLEAKDGSIPAHKIILQARSPAIFTSIQETNGNQSISIPDFDKRTLNALVSYIYCGRIDDMYPVMQPDLYDAAEKYRLRELSNAIAPNKIYATTEITNEVYDYTWRLKNFSTLAAQTIRYSEKFYTGHSCRSWSLSVSFQKIPDDDDDLNVGIFLNKLWTTGEKKAVFIHFSISLLDRNGMQHHTAQAQKLYKNSGRYGFPCFAKRSILLQQKDLLAADTLTILCKMRICDGANSSRVQHSFSSSSGSEINDVENISACFREMYLSGVDCDVTVRATEKEFRLHKPILCARSSVFTDFFDRYSNGLHNYTINIQGIKADILELFFEFVYSGQLANELTCYTAPSLYMAADHYKISGLKRICSDFMKSNACDIMLLANQSSDAKMREFARDFICSNAEDIFVTDKWAELVKNHPEIVSEILKSLSGGYREAKRRRLE